MKDNSRKYILMVNRREFHLTSSSESPCQPLDNEKIGYSDSKESLMNQGFLPCRWCLSEITLDEINSAKNKSLTHNTFIVD